MRKLALAIPVVAALVLAIPAAASPPEDVEFTIYTETPEEGPTTGNFFASGSAVSDIVCASGTIEDTGKKVTAFQRGNGVEVNSLRLFTCSDGTFTMRFHAHIVFSPYNASGNWTILRGTGAYEQLHGTGISTTGDLVFGDPFLATDTFTGNLHSD